MDRLVGDDRLHGVDPLRGELRPAGPVRFALSEVQKTGGTVLAVNGELDLLTAPKLAARIDRIMRRRRGDLVLDLRGAEFIDSVGLSVLLSAHRRLDRASRRLTVVCAE